MFGRTFENCLNEAQELQEVEVEVTPGLLLREAQAKAQLINVPHHHIPHNKQKTTPQKKTQKLTKNPKSQQKNPTSPQKIPTNPWAPRRWK